MAFEESEIVIPELEREENLIAAARHIVRALGSKKNLTSDAKKVLADLGTKLSSISKVSEKNEEEEEEEEKEEGVGAFEDRLDAIQEIIMKWEEENQSMNWDEAASEYLNAAEEVHGLIEKLESLDLGKEDQGYDKVLNKAYSVLQTAMSRLEEEFRNMLVQNKQPFEPEYVSFRSSNEEDNIADEGSVVSLGDDSVEESFRRDSVSRGASEEHIIDLVHPDVIPHLRCISNLMFSCNYDHECSHAYTIARKDALDECFSCLEMERFSIESVLRMEWGTLNSKIKRWIWALRVFVRVYLASERWLSDQVFGEGETISLVCFVNASKASMLRLLNFGEAMSIGPHQPEKLFKILDMYEVMDSLMPELDALYSDEIGSSVRHECHEILKRLGDCVRQTFLEFENAVASNVSTSPFVGGGVHPLTRYVMNYVTTLTDYSETLDMLLNKDQEKVQDHGNGISSFALHLRSVASILECNLDEKSKLYKEASLQHLFLMNNIHYMAQKAKKSSELRLVYDDEWIRKHNWKFRQHAINYERTSLSSILNLLKDEGIQIPGTNSVSKTLLKERLRSFYLAFEELYRNQTSWFIQDVQLREELRISLSLKVIQAYRTFVGRHSNYISDKYIKYNADDLENYLLDFFEGAPKSLQNLHRK